MTMKNPNNTIGNRACDLPVCSPLPRPTAPLLAQWIVSTDNKFQLLGVNFNTEYILSWKDVYRKGYNYFYWCKINNLSIHFGFNYMPSPHKNLKNNFRTTSTNSSTSEIPNNLVIFIYTRKIMLWNIFCTIISKHFLHKDIHNVQGTDIFKLSLILRVYCVLTVSSTRILIGLITASNSSQNR
jgi:hypothetical protein